MSEETTEVKLELTDAEWLQLLDGENDDSELPTCCANISALRDSLMSHVRAGRNRAIPSWKVREITQRLGWVADGHDLTPLLKKVCKQLNYTPGEEHEPQSLEV